MTRLILFVGFLTLGCAARAKDLAGASFVCETDPGDMPGTIAEWARSSAAESDSLGQRFRTEYGIAGATRAEWDRQIAIVHDNGACRQAAVAYAGAGPVRPGVHRVALVAVGNRYVAVDLGAIRKAGEFLLEAVLDRQFRLVHMLAT
jgi:hypothetical protein